MTAPVSTLKPTKAEIEERKRLGYEHYKKKEYSEAAKWHRKAAEQGNADAKQALAELNLYFFVGRQGKNAGRHNPVSEAHIDPTNKKHSISKEVRLMSLPATMV